MSYSRKKYYKSAQLYLHDSTVLFMRELLGFAKKNVYTKPKDFAKIVYTGLDDDLRHLVDEKGGLDELVRLAYYAKQRGYLSINDLLTGAGAERLKALEAKIEHKQITKETWDGYWRVISYDIPEDNRRARYAIRSLLKRLGCVQLQQSLWVHPADIVVDVQNIRLEYGAQKDIFIIVSDRIHDDESLKEFFKL